jgi:hypothetical protein
MKIIKGLILLNFFLLVFSGSLSAEPKWLEERSRHFIVYYQEGIDWGFLSETVYYAEKFYDDISENLGFRRYDFWLWEKRARIYIYKDKETYVKSTGMPEWSGGRAIYEQKIIESFPWAKGFFSQLLAHELGHIIFREFVGPQAKVPMWFEEGVASSQETERYRLNREKTLVHALKNQSLISLVNLTKIDPRRIQDEYTATLFYAQAESLVRFLIDKFGKYEFVKLCRLIRDYKDFYIALPKAYPRYEKLEDLDKDWTEFVRNNLIHN